MNIVLYDPYGGKFTQDMQDWWIKKGHQVKYSRYYDPSLVTWGDVLWFDTCDNNILSATNPSQALLDDEANFKPWALRDHDLANKRVVVRPIDIEVWQQHHLAVDWKLVDDIIFIADHIREVFGEVETNAKFHTIPCGLNLDKWTFKEREPGFDIAIVSEKWASKGTHLLLQVILKLHRLDPRYKFHWLGQRSDHNWEYAYFDEFVEHHQLPIEFTNILLDGITVDEFLEGKNFLLHGSIKEGFSYATAEAMAKGIKPVTHRFFGADNIWENTWDTVDEAVEMITNGEYDSKSYRQYLIDRGYTIESMMSAITNIIERR